MAGAAGSAQNPIRVSETTAVRTLLKSVPELWTACSDAEALAGHLGAFGEITISRLEPETTVAWESDRASGTVTLEPAGWGTKVTMTAITVQERPSDEMERVAEETPPVEEVSQIEEAPPIEEPPAVEEAPAAEETPAAEEAPAAEQTPPVEEAPAGDEALHFEQAPPQPTGLFARLSARWRSRQVATMSESADDNDPATEETPAPSASAEPPAPEPPTLERSAAEEPTTESPTAEPPTPEPPAAELAQLEAALDSLGQAHHRPFSTRDVARG